MPVDSFIIMNADQTTSSAQAILPHWLSKCNRIEKVMNSDCFDLTGYNIFHICGPLLQRTHKTIRRFDVHWSNAAFKVCLRWAFKYVALVYFNSTWSIGWKASRLLHAQRVNRYVYTHAAIFMRNLYGKQHEMDETFDSKLVERQGQW